MKLRLPSDERIVRTSCVLALVGLALMVWSVLDPTVWPVLVALSLGQVVGTISLLLFLVVVVKDLAIVKRLRGRAKPDPEP